MWAEIVAYLAIVLAFGGYALAAIIYLNGRK